MGTRSMRHFACAASLAIAGTCAQAADITSWAVGPAFTGAGGFNGVLTNGSLVAAVDFGSAAVMRTVDPGGLNITFSVVDPAFFSGYIFATGTPTSGDAGWDAVIGDADWNSPGDLTVNSFLTGLTPGAGYQLQLFAADSRSCCSARTSRFGDGHGNYSGFVVQGSATSIVATFVATATTQALEFDTSSNAPILNAYVLREVAPVPEPGTLALMLCGLLGTAAVSRRRPD